MTARPLKLLTMREALESPSYLGSEAMLGAASWSAWRVLLLAAVGEALTDAEREVFRKLSGGRQREPLEMLERLVAIVGRRGGKSRAIAALAAYLSVGFDYRGALAPGQVALIPIIAASKEQAAEIFRYLRGIFTTASGFKPLLDGDPTAVAIRLKTQVEIQIRASSFRRARGFTAVAALIDEAAFLPHEDSAAPDRELIQALEPSLATTGGPLILISSAYARRGEVWTHFRDHYGPDGDPRILVVRADSKTMNPGLSEAWIKRAYERDPIAAASEIGSEFRNDVSAFVSHELVEAATLSGTTVIPPRSGGQYVGFVDAASGSGGDSMTAAVAFRDGDDYVLACLMEKTPPFDPELTVAEFCKTFERYGIKAVRGDRWAAGFVEQAFGRHGIRYEPSDRTKSQLYSELAPLLAAGQVKLLDDPRMTAQLLALERRVARGGRDSVDHPPRGHDDRINAACGALCGAAGLAGGETDVPFAQSGTYRLSLYGDAPSIADRRDKMSPQQAFDRGLLSRERAQKMGVKIPC